MLRFSIRKYSFSLISILYNTFNESNLFNDDTIKDLKIDDPIIDFDKEKKIIDDNIKSIGLSETIKDDPILSQENRNVFLSPKTKNHEKTYFFNVFFAKYYLRFFF